MDNNTPRPAVDITDLERAADELRQVGAMSSDHARREAIAKISTAALLDIAASLRIVAAEAELAMLGPDGFVEAPDDEPMTDLDRDFLVVGDRVRVLVDADTRGTVTKIGMSEGEPYALIEVDENLPHAGDVRKYFVRHLERIVGEPDDESEEDESDEDADVEDDFTPPASALDALREVEKKTAKKKGKKS